MKVQITLLVVFSIIVTTLAAELQKPTSEKRDKRGLYPYYGYAGVYPYASPYAYPYAYAPTAYGAYPAYAAPYYSAGYSSFYGASPFAYYG